MPGRDGAASARVLWAAGWIPPWLLRGTTGGKSSARLSTSLSSPISAGSSLQLAAAWLPRLRRSFSGLARDGGATSGLPALPECGYHSAGPIRLGSRVGLLASAVGTSSPGLLAAFDAVHRTAAGSDARCSSESRIPRRLFAPLRASAFTMAHGLRRCKSRCAGRQSH